MQTRVLDHGFVRLVRHMGDDRAIVEAARVSYGKGTKTAREDADLIDYLMRHGHTSPFEMVEMTFHIKLPIFVARQLIRHRTASLNEYSGRYSVMSTEFYLPELERIQKQDTTNKQGSAGALDDEDAMRVVRNMNGLSHDAFECYEANLGFGVARETARITLPLNAYTEMYWKIDLHNLFHFLRLRLDSHAQWEIQQYANALGMFADDIAPVAYQAFVRHRLNAVTFSEDEMAILKQCLGSEMVKTRLEQSGLRSSRQREFLAKVGL